MFTVTITDFGNAATIGGDYSVLATEIYNQVVGQMNFNLGAVVGIMLLLPTVLAFYLERVASQQAVRFGQRLRRADPAPVDSAPRHSDDVRRVDHRTDTDHHSGIVVFASFVWLWPYRFDLTLRHYDVKISGGDNPAVDDHLHIGGSRSDRHDLDVACWRRRCSACRANS